MNAQKLVLRQNFSPNQKREFSKSNRINSIPIADFNQVEDTQVFLKEIEQKSIQFDQKYNDLLIIHLSLKTYTIDQDFDQIEVPKIDQELKQHKLSEIKFEQKQFLEEIFTKDKKFLEFLRK